MASLVLWMNGIKVATWTEHRGTSSLQYEADWVNSPNGRAISLSLPFTPGNAPHRGEAVTNYFDNLLPDSDPIRVRLRARYGTDSTDAFALLSAIGRDCVGAIQLLPPGEAPEGWDKIRAEPLSDRAVEMEIDAMLTGRRVLGQEDPVDFRISIAGAQEKTALLRHEGRWCRPLGSTPTTHLLKLPLGTVGALQMDLEDSVENEWLCLNLLRELGLPTPDCELRKFGDRRTLVVERFDRRRQSGGWIARLPQEDFCQALGLPSTMKYESDGGPGMREIVRLLDAGSQPVEDKTAFVKAQLIFWLLAATDGHAKNFSIFHERGGIHRLTPFYDVLSAWPVIGKGANRLDIQKAKLAMAIRSKNAHWKIMEIKRRHWDTVTRQAGLGAADAIVHDVLGKVAPAISNVGARLPARFPARVRDAIFEGLQRNANSLGAE